MSEITVNVENIDDIISLFGSYDANVNLLQKQYNVSILSRGNDIRINGDDQNVKSAASAVETLLGMIRRGEAVTEQSIRYVSQMVSEGEEKQITQLSGDGICVTVSGKVVKPKTVGQKAYIDAISKNTIVLGVGPAGTGKTCCDGCKGIQGA